MEYLSVSHLNDVFHTKLSEGPKPYHGILPYFDSASYICHRLRNRETELMVCALLLEMVGKGCQWMCRWVHMTLLHMHKVFPT